MLTVTQFYVELSNRSCS